MWPISPACSAALLGPHTRVPVLELYQGFGPMLASTYSKPLIVVESDGGVDVSWTGQFVRSLHATIVDVDGTLAPAVPLPNNPRSAYVDPIQRPQLQVYFDIGWNDPITGVYTTERIPVGRFVITRSTDTEVGVGGTIAITGTQRSGCTVRDNVWLSPFNLAGGVPYSTAIQAALVDRTMPGWQQAFRFEQSITQTPFGVVYGGSGASDPWTDLQALAVSDGRELIEDQVGAFVYRTPPSLIANQIPTWTYDDVSSTRLKNSVVRDSDIANAYNGVILRSSAPWLLVPLISTLWVTDPGSPLYYAGPLGQRPFQIDDAVVSSQSQADAACAVQFAKVVGVSEQVSFDALPNPAHDPGDMVKVQSLATAVSDNVLLQTFSLPFDVTASMPVTVNRLRHA